MRPALEAMRVAVFTIRVRAVLVRARVNGPAARILAVRMRV